MTIQFVRCANTIHILVNEHDRGCFTFSGPYFGCGWTNFGGSLRFFGKWNPKT